MAARVILAIALAVGLIAFILYGADKRRARKGRWRIPESVLLGFGFFGGSIGALLGMYLFRHKTKHWYFWVVNWAGLALLAVIFWYFGLREL